MRSNRWFVLAVLAGVAASVASACTGGGGDSSGLLGLDGGSSSSGSASSGGSSSSGVITSSSSSGIMSSSSSGSTTSSSSGGPADAAPDAPTSCVTKSVVIAIIQQDSGSCSYKFTAPYDADKINLVLTPGWGTVCSAGSSSNCGTGSSADGWWFSASDEISVCDATCARFEKQINAGKFTVELGCPTETCMH